MTNKQESTKRRKGGWPSASAWTIIAAIATIVGVVVAILAWQLPKTSSSADPSETVETASSSTNAPGTVNSSATTTTSTPISESVTDEEISSPGSIFISDIEEDEFIREPATAERGAASIANDDFPSSYYYRFTNCSTCKYETELNIPSTYSRFTGTFGLTDESRHDDVIDGVVYFSIQSVTGEQLWPPTKIEYPEQVPFEVDLTGVNRIRLIVSEGTNAEYACWCDARLTR